MRLRTPRPRPGLFLAALERTRIALADRAVEGGAGLLDQPLAELLPKDAQRHLLHGLDVELVELERPEGDADQPVHLEPEMLADHLDLAVLALADAHGEPEVVALAAFHARLDRTVLDPVDGQTLIEGCEPRLVDLAEGPDPVAAQPAGRRQFERALDAAVVGEEQQPLGVDVEASDGEHARQMTRQHLEHGRPTVRIALGGHETARLVIEPEARALGRRQGLAVDGDAVAARDVERGAFDDLAVDRDAALVDPVLDLAARAEARTRDDLGDALAGERLVVVARGARAAVVARTARAVEAGAVVARSVERAARSVRPAAGGSERFLVFGHRGLLTGHVGEGEAGEGG